MKLELADLSPSEREALLQASPRGLHRCPGGFHPHDGGQVHTARTVMSLQRRELIHFAGGDTTKPGTVTSAGRLLLDGQPIEIEHQEAS